VPQARKEREATDFLAYVDAAGRFCDFHALRHTAGSLLAASGVHPKVAQSIMRHSTIDLTMSRYSHVFAGQEADAVAGLPDLSAAPASQAIRRTGTDLAQAGRAAPGWPAPNDLPDGRHVGRPNAASGPGHSLNPAAKRQGADRAETGDSVLAVCLAHLGGIVSNGVRRSDMNAGGNPSLSENENARISEETRAFPKQTGEAGIRTRAAGLSPQNGLANRRLQPLGHLS